MSVAGSLLVSLVESLDVAVGVVSVVAVDVGCVAVGGVGGEGGVTLPGGVGGTTVDGVTLGVTGKLPVGGGVTLGLTDGETLGCGGVGALEVTGAVVSPAVVELGGVAGSLAVSPQPASPSSRPTPTSFAPPRKASELLRAGTGSS